MARKILLIATLMFAAMTAQAKVYELRTYTAPEGKLEALKARFRDHTIRIFNRLGMESVGYWVPQGDKSKNTLIYILSFPNREAATKAWAAFLADAEWKKVQADSEKDGPLATKVESLFLDPTEFSLLK